MKRLKMRGALTPGAFWMGDSLAGAKAQHFYGYFAARLKPCPVTRPVEFDERTALMNVQRLS
jgi:hypothetical protein